MTLCDPLATAGFLVMVLLLACLIEIIVCDGWV